jgi:hypothetical protein
MNIIKCKKEKNAFVDDDNNIITVTAETYLDSLTVDRHLATLMRKRIPVLQQ